MAKDTIIPNALGLAQLVAHCILEDSYRIDDFGPKKLSDGTYLIDMMPEKRSDAIGSVGVSMFGEGVHGVIGEIVRYEEPVQVYNASEWRGVHDVLLFGSTMRGEESHDIDLVLIHNQNRLQEYESKLKYGKDGCSVVDFSRKIDEKRLYNPSTILRDLEGRDITTCHFEEGLQIQEYFKYVVERADRENSFSGTFCLDYIDNPVVFTSKDRAGFQKEVDVLFEYLMEGKVNTKVRGMFSERGLNVDGDFDLLLLSKETLYSSGAKRRGVMTDLCRDPTFWYTVLSEGRLYNLATEKFDLEVEQKYPGAVELFKR
ncbi:hypothetical protein A2642_05175 [Candidatus Nomurabacteria bacterium RIFCSPHIGHO2_01_FULL_39_10]|uniref:Uncharacterized protein n=1 Tax=Candidatus Nomurabacteria bacterium RIFCSPHIGHO2_01_FULL_39_10 TaxID=1801733 RepID=A0A1F6V2L2_9BACT|nr:MAG: hypothetical protein A2642_05175 [Candidatus Nomurabacteria bacterium RIFCSPHIGHO2_01_FULL_39_10]